MSNDPKWLHAEKATRVNSGKQEKKLAKEMGGRLFANSGAKYGENDVKTDKFEIEAKTTEAKSFILKVSEIEALHKKCRIDKIGLFIIEFSKHGEELVILRKADFYTIAGLNTPK